MKQPPKQIQIEGYFHQWISLLRDYRTASHEWKQSLEEELYECYTTLLTLGDNEDIETNAYISIIKSRTFEQHLSMVKAKGPVLS